MLVKDEHVKTAIQRVTPVIISWLANGEYPTGGDIWIDHTRYGDIYVAVMVTDDDADVDELRQFIDDIDDEYNHSDAMRRLGEISEAGHIAFGQGQSPAEALFYAEMELRKQVLQFIHEVLLEDPERMEDAFNRYSPLKALTDDERNVFLDDCGLLLQDLSLTWYEYQNV